MIELCDKCNIRLVLLPANSNHLTQPLDVAFFVQILPWYKYENPRQAGLNKARFATLLTKVIEEINISKKEKWSVDSKPPT